MKFIVGCALRKWQADMLVYKRRVMRETDSTRMDSNGYRILMGIQDETPACRNENARPILVWHFFNCVREMLEIVYIEYW